MYRYYKSLKEGESGGGEGASWTLLNEDGDVDEPDDAQDLRPARVAEGADATSGAAAAANGGRTYMRLDDSLHGPGLTHSP